MISHLIRKGALAAGGTMAALCCCAAGVMLAADPPRADDKLAEPPPPTFSVAGGVFTNDFKVSLEGGPAMVRFTTDGSEPGWNATVYREPVQITNCAVLRARAWYPDGRASQTVSQSYTVLGEDLRGFSSNLPLIVVDSCAGEVTSAEKSLTGIRILANKSTRTTLLGRADFSGLALVNVRGHSSLRYPKHSYSVKTVNDFMEARKASILDLPKESDWVLYGPYPDKTLLRDVLAYELSNQMGRWAPRTRFVEVFVNETGTRLTMEHYAGVYVFEEKITRGQTRVDLAKLDPTENREPDLTGGYIFKKDHTGGRERKKFDADGPPQAPFATNRAGFPTPPGGFPADPDGFLPPYETTSTTRTAKSLATRTNKAGAKIPRSARLVTNHVAAVVPEAIQIGDTAIFPDEESFRTTLQRNQFYFYDPEPDEITAVQRAWLKDYVNRFEAALYGPDFTDPDKGYPAFIEADSFIDYHLLVEVTKNVDAFRFSTFYHKDRGGRLKMGPAWDWNLSFGNADGKQGWLSERWLWPQLDDQQYSWFRRLFEDPDFGQRYVDRWAQLRTNVFATAAILARIDALAAQLNEAQERNFARWAILGRDVNPNWFVGDSYQEEIDWMKEWITKRLAWIEAQFPPAPTVQADKTITLATPLPAARILYTLDGTDPRASGGGVSAAARPYESPLSLPKNAKLFARVLNGTRWSAPALLPSAR